MLKYFLHVSYCLHDTEHTVSCCMFEVQYFVNKFILVKYLFCMVLFYYNVLVEKMLSITGFSLCFSTEKYIRIH